MKQNQRKMDLEKVKKNYFIKLLFALLAAVFTPIVLTVVAGVITLIGCVSPLVIIVAAIFGKVEINVVDDKGNRKWVKIG